MAKYLESFLTDESGQGFTEYALILALVSVGLITITIALRDEIGTVFDAIITELQGAPDGEYTSGA